MNERKNDHRQEEEFSYKNTMTQRQSKHRFRLVNVEEKQAKNTATSQVIHRYDTHAVIKANEPDQERLKQEAERKYSPRRHFIAYFDERDGKGIIKDTTDSALQDMVRFIHGTRFFNLNDGRLN